MPRTSTVARGLALAAAPLLGAVPTAAAASNHGVRVHISGFDFTGGTGQFAGATGGGLEMGVPAVGIFYDGVLSN
jgi:hypothetical protein